MDIFSHALWTNLVFKELPMEQRSYVISFSVMPDIVSFMRMSGKGLFRKLIEHKNPDLRDYPKVVQNLYNYTHSIVVWLGVIIILKLLNLGLIIMAIYGWAFHIVTDIFTHTKKHFPTPVFWPISNFKFSGIAWSNRWFLLVNYSILALLYKVFYF